MNYKSKTTDFVQKIKNVVLCVRKEQWFAYALLLLSCKEREEVIKNKA